VCYRPSEARDPLALVHGWVTDGLDTIDLKEAKKAARVFNRG
jgi:hypothetical protein